jgi:predicted kinase
VRKRLAGLDLLAKQRLDIDEGIYAHEWSDRTAACLEWAADLSSRRPRVIDATFVESSRREAFVHAAIGWGVPVILLVVHATPELIRERLAARRGPIRRRLTVYEPCRGRRSIGCCVAAVGSTRAAASRHAQ